jgi:hypothetical protein
MSGSTALVEDRKINPPWADYRNEILQRVHLLLKYWNTEFVSTSRRPHFPDAHSH